jgi:hypothetical protein
MRVHEREIELLDSDGVVYARADVYVEPQRQGTWQAWIEFTSLDGSRVVRTDRETTQSTLEGVAYWATGLERTFLQGALDRALRRELAPPPSEARSAPPAAAVDLRIVAADPEVPFRLMAKRTLVPGAQRYVHNAGVITFKAVVREATGPATPGIYAFTAQFSSDTAAALLANRIWSDLHGLGARLQVAGEDVPLDHVALRDAMVGALVR